MLEADYVIVGAGSAGCVLANRLSADPRVRVVLIEAGGDDRPLKNPKQFRTNMLIHVPIGFAEAMNDPQIRWDLQTEAEPGAGNRRLPIIRAKVMGGCSSINAMLYVRGERADYDQWSTLGCSGWSWDEVLPYFRRAQHQERGESAWHGVGGPLNVTDQRTFDVSERVLEAAAAAGIPTVDDINTGSQFGGVRAQVTMRGGWRHSAAVAYLHPAMSRPNLVVLTEALVTKVLFEGKRAIGVALRRDGIDSTVCARMEVIVAAGALNSPPLLEISGIGQAERLAALGLPVIVDSPGVGEHLQDHYMSYVGFELQPGTVSINQLTRGWPMAQEALKYLFTRKGLLAQSAAQLLIYAKSDPHLPMADIQYSVTPATMKEMKDPAKRSERAETAHEPGLTFGPCQLRPASRGWVHLRSANPLERPAIQFNYLTAPQDQAVHVAAIRTARHIVSQAPLADLVVRELTPGSEARTDDEILDFVRRYGDTVYHPVGTVHMGRDDTAPLDTRLRVRGVAGLRVVDASVMPRLVSGNTNAPTIMIAEKASDMILEDAKAGIASVTIPLRGTAQA